MTPDRDMALLWMPSRNVAAGASSRAGLPVWRKEAWCPHRLSPGPRTRPGSTSSAGSTSPASRITSSRSIPAGGGWSTGRCRTWSRSCWRWSPSWRFMGGCWWWSTSPPRSVRWRLRWPARAVSRSPTCRGCRCAGSLTCPPGGQDRRPRRAPHRRRRTHAAARSATGRPGGAHHRRARGARRVRRRPGHRGDPADLKGMPERIDIDPAHRSERDGTGSTRIGR